MGWCDRGEVRGERVETWEGDKREREREREREINKKMIALCYSAVSKMRAHCSSIAKILAYAIFDGASFWIIRASPIGNSILSYFTISKGHFINYTILPTSQLLFSYSTH